MSHPDSVEKLEAKFIEVKNNGVDLGSTNSSCKSNLRSSKFDHRCKCEWFESEGNVAWKDIDADQRVPSYGYFSINAKGGVVIEPLTIDDIPEGHYPLYFGTDENDDGIFDSPSATFVESDTPCPDIPREETVQPQPSRPTSQQTDPIGSDSLPQLGTGRVWTDLCNFFRNALYNSCDIYVNSDGSLHARELHALEYIRNGLILAVTGKPIIFFLLRSINHG